MMQTSAIGIWWIEARDVAKYPTIYKMFPVPQNEVSGLKCQ